MIRKILCFLERVSDKMIPRWHSFSLLLARLDHLIQIDHFQSN